MFQGEKSFVGIGLAYLAKTATLTLTGIPLRGRPQVETCRENRPVPGWERVAGRSPRPCRGRGLDRHGGLDASAYLPPVPSPGNAGVARGALVGRAVGRSAVHAGDDQPGADRPADR